MVGACKCGALKYNMHNKNLSRIPWMCDYCAWKKVIQDRRIIKGMESVLISNPPKRKLVPITRARPNEIIAA